jgi:hypothetical protein
VWQIVTNPGYRGEYVADKARHLVVSIPPIVTDDDWAATKEGLAGRRQYAEPRARNVSLCEGIAVCGVCGEPMLLTASRSKFGQRRLIRYYACRDKKRNGRGIPRCPNPMQQVEDVDARVWAVVRRVIENPELLAEALSHRKDKGEETKTDWKKELKDWERRLARLERAQAHILDLFNRGLVMPGAMELQLKNAERDRALYLRNRDLAHQELLRASQSQEDAQAFATTLQALRARLAASSKEEKRALVRLLVPGRDGLVVTLSPDKHILVAGALRSEPLPSSAIAAG